MTALRTCQCWKIERRDGRVFGFTDHDEDLLVAGDTYRAADALTPSEAQSAVGFDVDEMEVQGGFSAEGITEAALEDGEFDGAEVWVYRVDWADPASRTSPELQARFRIGKTTRARQGFVCEMRARIVELSHGHGRQFVPHCDAQLGDARCGVDLGSKDRQGCRLTQEVTIVERLGESRVRVSGLNDPSDRGFIGGLMTWDGEEYQGYRAQIRGQAGDVLSFWQTRPLPEPGTTATITAGCDKTYGTCQARFGNEMAFRGFPTMPSMVSMSPLSPRPASVNSSGGK